MYYSPVTHRFLHFTLYILHSYALFSHYATTVSSTNIQIISAGFVLMEKKLSVNIIYMWSKKICIKFGVIFFASTKILSIKLVNYWDKYTEMHGKKNVKKKC